MTGSVLAALVLRRLAALGALLVVLSFVTFSLLTLAPGSPEQILVGTRPTTPETLAALRAQYNLDEPFLVQYAMWMGDAVRLDLGESIRTNQPVSELLADRLELSVQLALVAFVLTVAAGAFLGTLAAIRNRSSVDRGVVGLSLLGVSSPAFVTGLLAIYLFAVELGWFPAFGAGEGPADRLSHLVLPALTLAAGTCALVVKVTRSAVLRELSADHVTFALARGLPWHRVLRRHVLRNAAIPILTSAGLVFSLLLGGAVLVEVTFALPGVGSLLVDATVNQDLPVVQGLTLMLATAIVLVNLLVDLLYMAVDPRVRVARAVR